MRTLKSFMCFAACWALAGSASAAKIDLEPKISPSNAAVKACNDFACDLYRSLGEENRGKNLFFSPYSISSALAMTLEGARSETAAEMGQVLRLPPALRGDAKELPWKTAPFHR